MIVRYPAGGWLSPGTSVNWQRSDQGRDLVIPWQHVLEAPGAGECVNVGSDQPFPNGFGPSYPWVRIDMGPFAGHTYYLGHCTSLVRTGDKFSFGHPLARADQGHDFNGTTGGWVELGEVQSGGILGPNSPGGHWFDRILMRDLKVRVPDPPLRFGDQGLSVLRMTGWLAECGWLPRRYWHFNRDVHGAVIAFDQYHHLPSNAGVVDARTHLVLMHAAAWCKQHHVREHA